MPGYRGNGSDRQPPDSDGERFAEWKAIWRKITRFLLDVLSFLEDGGRMIINGLDLGREIGAYFARRLHLTIALGIAVGISSPITNGWGIGPLSRSPLLIWLPVAGVPATIGLVALLVASLRLLEDEAVRSLRRRTAEQPDTRLERALEIEAERRAVITEELEKRAPAVSLEEQDFVADDLKRLYFKVNNASSPGDVKIVLMKWNGNHLAPVAKRGQIPRSMRDRLAIGWNDLTGIRESFDRILEPLRYRHYVVPFSADTYAHYVLASLSGATIPLHVRLDISRTATLLLAHHAYGENLPDWAVEES